MAGPGRPGGPPRAGRVPGGVAGSREPAGHGYRSRRGRLDRRDRAATPPGRASVVGGHAGAVDVGRNRRVHRADPGSRRRSPHRRIVGSREDLRERPDVAGCSSTIRGTAPGPGARWTAAGARRRCARTGAAAALLRRRCADGSTPDVQILFGFACGIGHFLPIAPIARAAQAAGHTVAVAGRPQHAAEVEALGLDVVPIGEDAEVSESRTPLRPLNPRLEDRVLREGFARRIARERAAALVPLAEAWRPDVIVCDETDFGAMVAAERVEIPHVNVLVLAAGSFARRSVIEGPLRELRAASPCRSWRRWGPGWRRARWAGYRRTCASSGSSPIGAAPAVRRGGLPRRVRERDRRARARGAAAAYVPRWGRTEPMNAALVEALGVGRTLDAIGSTPEDIRSGEAGDRRPDVSPGGRAGP